MSTRPKISGFSYIRNGFDFDYPFIEAIQSILPICDEFIMAVGDSTDETREAIEALASDKIQIVDTIWEESLRTGGQLFAQQANIALDQITGDWGFHIQADEAIHEKDLDQLRREIELAHSDPEVDGLLFPFLNFYGSYDYYGITRRWHRCEVRAVRNQDCVRSYRDSQGFRLYTSRETWEKGEPGRKLRVKKISAPVYHYNYVRNPQSMKKKGDYFHRFWHDDNWLDKNLAPEELDAIPTIDYLKRFEGTHPGVMQDRVGACDWEFFYRPEKIKPSLRDRFLFWVEQKTGWRIGEYRNYEIL